MTEQRARRAFTSKTRPPTDFSGFDGDTFTLGDRWRDETTGEEWSLADLDPVKWVSDGGTRTDVEGLSEACRRELVAEAFHTFGEHGARCLAASLGIEFEDCAEAIERGRHGPN